MAVEIIVSNTHCKITGLYDKSLINSISNELSFFVEGYQFMKAYKTGWFDRVTRRWSYWDGREKLLSKNLKFMVGLLPRVERILKKNKVKYAIKDIRDELKLGRKIKTKNIETRDYQDRVLDATLYSKGGIVKSATGSGKSVMITQLIANTNIKTMVYVIGIDLLYQMHETFEKMLGTKVGIVGDGNCDIRKINVCTIWTAANALGEKYEALDDEDQSRKEKLLESNKTKISKAIAESQLNLYDECHMASTKTIQQIHSASKSVLWTVGYSGTPSREDNSDLLIEGVCGEIIRDAEVTASELIAAGWLVKPTIHFVNVPEISKPGERYQSIYKNYIVDNDVRNAKIIKATKTLIGKGRKVLVLVKNINHGKVLLEELEQDHVVYFVRGEIDSDERNGIKADFIKGKIDVIIASVIFDQGIDIPVLDALVLAGGGKARARQLQRIGRVLRPSKGKKDAVVIDFLDNAKYLLDHSAIRRGVYLTESGFDVKLPKPQKSSPKSKKKKKKAAAW